MRVVPRLEYAGGGGALRANPDFAGAAHGSRIASVPRASACHRTPASTGLSHLTTARDSWLPAGGRDRRVRGDASLVVLGNRVRLREDH